MYAVRISFGFAFLESSWTRRDASDGRFLNTVCELEMLDLRIPRKSELPRYSNC